MYYSISSSDATKKQLYKQGILIYPQVECINILKFKFNNDDNFLYCLIICKMVNLQKLMLILNTDIQDVKIRILILIIYSTNHTY